ncbi:MAG TPA: GGDEF domain-containing protein [Gaiellaceae bacterium]|nr:GGDEF domain-containing protein [Gaiellaceae bacterium]
MRANGWELGIEIVQQGLRADVIPALARLGRTAQLGELPTFVAEVGRQLQQDHAERRLSAPLAAIAREHARTREEMGFAPRDVVTEFLIMRRVIWRFASDRADGIDLFELELRVNDMIDRVAAECVAAYVERAMTELTEQARRDPLTSLLNHQAFSEALVSEVERSGRYDAGLTVVYFDVDLFKEVNDSLGHVEGDRVLRRVADVASATLRSSDLAGRMGGDEFAVLLLQTDKHGGDRFMQRFRQGLEMLRERGDLPENFDVSAGSAHFPSEAGTAEGLLRLADHRQYACKRSKSVQRLEKTA